MAEMLVLEFEESAAADLYQKVNGLLGVDPHTGGGDWPAPLKAHLAGNAGGSMVVVEVWESQAAQEEFMASRLGPALHEAGAPEPHRVQWFSLLGSMHQH